MSRIHLHKAARILRRGGLVAWPTEAVYGLGCLPGERPAVERLLDLKRRSWRKGLSLIAASPAQLAPLVEWPQDALADEIRRSWPGPVTWVLKARRGVPHWLNGGRDTLAVRVTGHPLSRRLCEAAAGPLVSTSANRSGRPPLRRPLLVRREFGAGVDYVLTGELGGLPNPTAIRDGRTGAILRASVAPGALASSETGERSSAAEVAR